MAIDYWWRISATVSYGNFFVATLTLEYHFPYTEFVSRTSSNRIIRRRYRYKGEIKRGIVTRVLIYTFDLSLPSGIRDVCVYSRWRPRLSGLTPAYWPSRGYRFMFSIFQHPAALVLPAMVGLGCSKRTELVIYMPTDLSWLLTWRPYFVSWLDEVRFYDANSAELNHLLLENIDGYSHGVMAFIINNTSNSFL